MSIYSEIILDHYQNPRNFGEIEKATHTVNVANNLCGDRINMTIKLKNNQVVNIKFKGVGCAISTAASSMLTEHAKGKKLDELKKLDQKFIIKLLGIELGVNRIKCALLPLEALHKLI